MSTKVHFQAPGYHTATPYLIASNAAGAIDFYKQAFGATELMRIPAPGGKVGHAEIQIGDSRIMLADEAPQCQAFSPKTVGGTPVSLMLYVPDVDGMFNQAISLGAKVLQPVDDKFYGDRSGSLTDPFGHQWTIATHVEDVPPDELEKRAAALFGSK
jgi:PhnB protein